MRYTVGNLSLNVEEQGSGDPSLVFLHYWGGSLRTWSKVVAALTDSFHCVTYDIRGWGKSDAASSYTVSDMASEAASLIQTLDLERYVLIGHSMGGKVAQLVASRHPDGLVGLVLVAPAPPSPVRLPDKVREQQLHAYDNRETIIQTLGFLSAATPGPEILEQVVEDSLSGSREAVLAWPNGALLEDISSEVSKINVPTLILAGEQDQLDSIEQHRTEILARIPNARLEIITASGHLVPIDEPRQLALWIKTFATELPS